MSRSPARDSAAGRDQRGGVGGRCSGGAPSDALACATRGRGCATAVPQLVRQPMPSRLSSAARERVVQVPGWSHAVRAIGPDGTVRDRLAADLWTGGTGGRCGSSTRWRRLPGARQVDASAPDTPQNWCVGVQWILGEQNRARGGCEARDRVGRMSVGDVAGLIAAVAFVLLVGVLAIPLVKLGGVFDETRSMIKGVSDETVPLLSRGHHHGHHDQRPAGAGRRDHLQRPGRHDQRARR